MKILLMAGIMQVCPLCGEEQKKTGIVSNTGFEEVNEEGIISGWEIFEQMEWKDDDTIVKHGKKGVYSCTQEAHSGKRSVRFDTEGNSRYMRMRSDFFPVDGGKTYDVGFYHKVAEVEGGFSGAKSFAVFVYWFDKEKKSAGRQFAGKAIKAGGWEPMSNSVKAPAEAAYARVELGSIWKGNLLKMWIDDVWFKEVLSLPGF